MGGDWYTVSPKDFDEHLKLYKESGRQIVTTASLFDGTLETDDIMLHFDDGTADHAQVVAPLLEAHKMNGVFFINTAKIDQPGYFTATEVSSLAKKGHSIECHGHSHRRMDQMPPAILARELEQCVIEIEGLTGIKPRVLAPPGGFLSERVVATAANCGLSVIRGMSWGVNTLPLHCPLRCLVIHSQTRSTQISKWLQGRGLRSLRLYYLAKQTLQQLLPLDLYLKLRQSLGNRSYE